jgi:hypothetical protein
LSAKNCCKLNKITVSYQVDVILTCPDEKGSVKLGAKEAEGSIEEGWTSESAERGGRVGWVAVEEGIGNERVIEGIMCV